MFFYEKNGIRLWTKTESLNISTLILPLLTFTLIFLFLLLSPLAYQNSHLLWLCSIPIPKTFCNVHDGVGSELGQRMLTRWVVAAGLFLPSLLSSLSPSCCNMELWEEGCYSWRHMGFLAVQDSAEYKAGWRCRSRSHKQSHTDMQREQSESREGCQTIKKWDPSLESLPFPGLGN